MPAPAPRSTISLNTAANNFLINHASGNVVLNNLSAGTAQNRQFDLFVGNGGFETGGLDYWTFVGDPTLTSTLAGDDGDVAGEDSIPGVSDECLCILESMAVTLANILIPAHCRRPFPRLRAKNCWFPFG